MPDKEQEGSNPAEAEYGIGYVLQPDMPEREPQPYEGEGVGRKEQVYSQSESAQQAEQQDQQKPTEE
jgi:hypothetical protein